jgi:hypothetical protein
LSSLTVPSEEQYESIPDDGIPLLARKFCTLHKFHKERRRSPRGCFKCGDTTYFIADCHKRKKLDSSNKYDYTNWNDSSNKGDNKKKYHCRDKKKKKFQKIMFEVCVALSDFDFSSVDSSSSEEDEKVKCKLCDFTGFCLMGIFKEHLWLWLRCVIPGFYVKTKYSLYAWPRINCSIHTTKNVHR